MKQFSAYVWRAQLLFFLFILFPIVSSQLSREMYLIICVYVGGQCAIAHIWGSEDDSREFPLALWVPGIELSS